MVSVLFSRPNHDVALSYLFFYSKDLVEISERLGYKTIDKQEKMSTKEIITSIIEKNKPDLIMFNGHGSPNLICGHKNEIIISDDNVGILKGIISYSLTCSSALILGSEAVKKVAKAFIGYKFDFALGKDPDSEASPRKDKIAKLFLEPSNILFSALSRTHGINSGACSGFLSTQDLRLLSHELK